MNYTIDHKSNEQKDRRKSAVITAVVAILAFLIIFFYKFTRLIPQEEIDRRLTQWKPLRKPRTPALDRYASLVSSADKGAILRAPQE